MALKTLVLLTSMLSWSIFIFSQAEEESIDSKIRFGFNLGLNYSNLQVKETLPDKVEVYNEIGASFAILMDYAVTKRFLVSPKAELAFHNNSVDIIYAEYSIYSYNILPVSLNLMTHFTLKLNENKIIPYVFLGPNFKIPLSKKPEISTDIYSTADFAIDFGIGLENLNRFFVFAPELKYSWGLLNINQNPSIREMYFHSISLVLNFK